jgi:hypothetical protein
MKELSTACEKRAKQRKHSAVSRQLSAKTKKAVD